MKTGLLLIGGLLATLAATTAQAQGNLQGGIYDSLNLRFPKRLRPFTDDHSVLLQRLYSLSDSIGNKHLVPPHNKMPCLVPDVSGLSAIPNAFSGTVVVPYTGRPPHIPNPALPLPPPPKTGSR